MDFTSDQSRQLREFVSYTLVDMAHLCATHGWDRGRSRSVERLLSDLTPAPLGYRRSMVVGRQLFLFSHAYRLSRDPRYEECARRLFADLVDNFWDRANDGWYFSLNDNDSPNDTTKDSYGHAFVMFGLAHYLAVFQDGMLCSGLIVPMI
jgi:mannose/cellobiose epimerase-like protein (N-acyl-D-glucosamine 2-epimerase family)